MKVKIEYVQFEMMDFLNIQGFKHEYLEVCER